MIISMKSWPLSSTSLCHCKMASSEEYSYVTSAIRDQLNRCKAELNKRHQKKKKERKKWAVAYKVWFNLRSYQPGLVITSTHSNKNHYPWAFKKGEAKITTLSWQAWHWRRAGFTEDFETTGCTFQTFSHSLHISEILPPVSAYLKPTTLGKHWTSLKLVTLRQSRFLG